MRFVSVDFERFRDVMERCGAYKSDCIDKGYTHSKELWCRSLSRWAGETVVGTSTFYHFNGKTWYTYSIAGYLDDYYK